MRGQTDGAGVNTMTARQCMMMGLADTTNKADRMFQTVYDTSDIDVEVLDLGLSAFSEEDELYAEDRNRKILKNQEGSYLASA